MPQTKLEKSSQRKRRSTDAEGGDSQGVVKKITSLKQGLKIKLKVDDVNQTNNKRKKPLLKMDSDIKANKDHIEDKMECVDPVDGFGEDGNAAAVAEDDEEAWLDALEKGDLDDYGELKKEKDPNLMTARQRALKERIGSGLSSKSFANVTLLGGSTEVQAVSEEAQKKKDEKNKRRKIRAVKKAEENQKQTIERLVKHQGVRNNKERQKKAVVNGDNAAAPQQTDVKCIPMIRYVSRGSLITVSFPKDMEIPGVKSTGEVPCREKPPCVVCGKAKRYNCSRTKAPICSLECYRLNLARSAD